ncbi:913_t:CDS:2 [Ambispora leptoticha]|uniref:913_t:CDS:1 n=1 Tax=Ambispora leptoticha TaxID=144679 RepID=A0A9N8ZYU7_9GLOM|nr:913_t:CDS:2 [Ambispora leptoticha]
MKQFVAIALILASSLFALSNAAPAPFGDTIKQSANGGNGGNGGNAYGGSAYANSGAIALGGPAKGGNGGNGGNGGTNVAVQDVY